MNSVRDYLLSLQQRNSGTSGQYEISSCPQLIERIQQLGFLPLLDSGIDGYCAEEMMAPDYHYVQFDDGSWEWPLWTWKGPAITDGNCVYGKFFREAYHPPHTAGVVQTHPRPSAEILPEATDKQLNKLIK